MALNVFSKASWTQRNVLFSFLASVCQMPEKEFLLPSQGQWLLLTSQVIWCVRPQPDTFLATESKGRWESRHNEPHAVGQTWFPKKDELGNYYVKHEKEKVLKFCPLHLLTARITHTYTFQQITPPNKIISHTRIRHSSSPQRAQPRDTLSHPVSRLSLSG